MSIIIKKTSIAWSTGAQESQFSFGYIQRRPRTRSPRDSVGGGDKRVKGRDAIIGLVEGLISTSLLIFQEAKFFWFGLFVF